MGSYQIFHFGAWLQARRKFLGLSQDQLGRLVSYSTVSIRKLEEGSRRPAEAMTSLLARALEVPAKYHEAFTLSARSGVVEPSLVNWITNQQVFDALTRDPSARDALTSDASSPARVASETDISPPLRQLIATRSQIYGRETEITEILSLLSQPFISLITLMGPPGVGKTRLALEILDRVEPMDWPDGRFFVPLATIDQAMLIPEVIAATLGIREMHTHWRETQPIRAVFKFIQDKQLLLVLDNFEHLLNGVHFILELLAVAPRVKILVTSRANLNVASEQEYPIASLPVPMIDSASSASPRVQIEHNPAVELFTTSARARRSRFKLTEANAMTVAELCQRMDGLPLALELAAVRIKVQTPEALLAQISAPPSLLSPATEPGSASAPAPAVQSPKLDNSVFNMLPPLDKELKAMPRRYQTLTEAITWSYNLLSAPTRQVFDRLSVFQGGFTGATAQAIAGASMNILETLANQSLIQVETKGDQIRFRLLEVIREFALKRCIETEALDEVHRHHADFFAAFVTQADAHMGIRHQTRWLPQRVLETPNIRVALNWCVDHDPGTGLMMARHLFYYWNSSGGCAEGRDWIKRLLDASQGHDELARERGLVLSGSVALGNPVAVNAILEFVNLSRQNQDPFATAYGLQMLGMRLRSVDPKQGMIYLYEAKDLFDAQHNPWYAGKVRMLLSVSLYTQGRYADCEQMLKETLEIHARDHDDLSIARARGLSGWVSYAQGHYENALDLATQAAQLNRTLQDTFGLLEALTNLVFIEIELNQFSQARANIDEGMRVVKDSGHEAYASLFLYAAGVLANRHGEPREAVSLYLQSLEIALRQRRFDYIWLNLIHMAQLEVQQIGNNITGAREVAAAVLEWMAVVQQDSNVVGYVFHLAYQTRIDHLLKFAREILGEHETEQAMQRGTQRSIETVIEAARGRANQWLTSLPV